MGPLQLTVAWYKKHLAGEQATQWGIKKKRLHSVTLEFSLF